MDQGMRRSANCLRHLPIIALALALPASSMTSDVATEASAPSVAQRALIEVHDTAGIGWWSSSALEIGPAPTVIRATNGSAGPLASVPGGFRPIRLPGVASE